MVLEQDRKEARLLSEKVAQAAASRSKPESADKAATRYRRFRPLQLGQSFNMRHSNTTLTEDGHEIGDLDVATSVLTTFCLRRMEDPNWAQLVDKNTQVLTKEVSEAETTIKYVDHIDQSTFNTEFSVYMTKRALECLPLIPDRFSQDKHEYAVKRTTVSYQAEAWPIPGDSIPTCGLSQTNGSYVIRHHWPPAVVDGRVRDLANLWGITVQVNEGRTVFEAVAQKMGNKVLFRLQTRVIYDGILTEAKTYNWFPAAN